jgi:hypothetical protein
VVPGGRAATRGLRTARTGIARDLTVIIKDAQLDRTDGATVLSAACKVRKVGWDRVYFGLDNATQADYVQEDASPFAAALLLPSMRQGEDLIIEGRISGQLHKGMHAIMEEVLRWDLGLKPIKIEADSLAADPPSPRRSASFFSGGVDSFYTYLKHQADPAEADRISGFILVNGFDIDRRNTRLWDRARQSVSSVAEADGVELVVVRSNIQGLVEPILLWDYAHGGCLAAVGLFLRGAFHQIYIPSTHSVAEQIPWGSNLALDGHWSTEGTAFIHDGTEATRLEKVSSQIARSSRALEHLRVCFANEKGAYNCGRCDKCLRTMINLYVAGVLEKSGTFPHHIDPQLVAAVPTIPGEHGGIFHGENLRALKEKNLAPELQQAISTSMSNAVVLKPGLRETIENRLKYLDHVYTGGYAYRLWDRLSGRTFS